MKPTTPSKESNLPAEPAEQTLDIERNLSFYSRQPYSIHNSHEK